MNYQQQEKANQDKFLEVIKKADPQLYMIKVALEETGIDAMIIPHVIRTLGNLTLGAGYGKVQIYMQARIITNIEATEKIKLDQDVIDKDR